MDPEKALVDLVDSVTNAESLVRELHAWIYRGGFKPSGCVDAKHELMRKLRHVANNLESCSAILRDLRGIEA